MFRFFGAFLLASVMHVGWSQAVPSPTEVLPDLLFVDFVEWNYSEVPGPVPCLDGEGLPGLCLPIVHLTDNLKTLACMASGVDVECLDSMQVVFLPVDISGRALRLLQSAERTLIRSIAVVVDSAINDPTLPPCHTPTTCLFTNPADLVALVPDPVCLLPRVTAALARALPVALANYYIEVERIINLWLPNHVRSGAVWPAVDSIVSPTMSGVGDLLGDLQEVIDDIASIQDFGDALSRAYRLQALYSYVTGQPAPILNFLPTDFEYQNTLGTDMQWPGIYEYELAKYTTKDEVLLGAALGELTDSWLDSLPIPPWASGAVDWLADQVLDEALGVAFVGDGALRISNPFLYEFIGYSGFLQVRAVSELRPIITPNAVNVPLPSVKLFCGLWPVGIRTPLRLIPPVPVFAFLPGLAEGAYITVPEGYPVPHTSLPIIPSPLGLMMPK